VSLDVGHRTRVFDGVSFPQEFVNLFTEIRPFGDLYLNNSLNWSEAIDFAGTRPGERLSVSPSATLNVGRHVLVDLSHEYRKFDLLEGGRLFTANLTQLKLVYQLNVRAFARVILQNTTIRQNAAVAADDVEPEERSVFSQALLSYKLNAQTAVYAGYSDDQFGLENVDLTRTGRTFFFKIGYAWVR
jgi:hypothetical protein